MATIEEVLKRGWQLHQSGNVDDAEEIYRKVLAQVPQSPEALVYLGIVQFDQHRFEDSCASYREALQIRDHFPIAWNNLGNTLRMMGEVEESERCFIKALDQDPNYLSAYKNRGTLWVWNGDIEQGLDWYEAALKIAPNDPEVLRNLGVIYLLLGNYDEGWPKYRWRWNMPEAYRPNCRAPLWQGESLTGKTILLYPEQGRGDAIHFVRMTKVLADQGAKVILQCESEMIPLFNSASGVSHLITSESPIPVVDYHASLIDVVDVWYTLHQELPFATDSIQDGYLDVSDALTQYWADWLNENHPTKRGQKRIGINWQGNRLHHADVYRSVKLETLGPLAAMEHLQLVNLQFGFGIEQLAEVGFGDSVIRLPEDTDATGGAFTDTAAVVKNLDAIVTTDTALAHLAAAVGTKVYLLLGRIPDWRWLMNGSSTPWYPQMQLIRQETMGDWSHVIRHCCDELSI